MATTYHDIATPRRRSAEPTKKWNSGKWSNQHRTVRNDYPREGTAPLSRTQLARICSLARQAFEYVHGAAPGSTAILTEWRRDQQTAAVGKSSLTVCGQTDYLKLLAHFAELAGESGVAYNAHLKDATAAHRVALHKLGEALEAAGKPEAYAAAICRSRFKCGLDKATSKQIWKLVFTIRGWKQKAAKVQAADEPF